MLSLGIKCAKRLSPRPNAGRLSIGVGGLAAELPMAKLPKLPIGDIATLVEDGPQGEAGPFPSALPAVLLRIKPPKGKPGFESSVRSSCPSFVSLNLRLKNGEGSSLVKRPVPEGDCKPPSVVNCRLVLGRLDAGEESPNGPEFCP